MKLNRYVGLLLAVAGLITAFAALSPVAQAAKPNPGYTQFAGCPNLYTENPNSLTCLRSEIKSGKFKMGNKEVPIEHPIVLTGGVQKLFSPTPVYFNSEGGLTKVKQKVPGGIIGLTGLTWLAEFLGIEALTLYATTELAGTPIVAGTAFAQLADQSAPGEHDRRSGQKLLRRVELGSDRPQPDDRYDQPAAAQQTDFRERTVP